MGHRTTYGAPLTLVWNFLLRSGSRYGAQGHLWGSLCLTMWHMTTYWALYGALYGAEVHLWGAGPSIGLSMGHRASMGLSIWLSMWHRALSVALYVAHYVAKVHPCGSLWGQGHL